jgi:hypothetical protein
VSFKVTVSGRTYRQRGLSVSRFAAKWQVDKKTVRRDLEAFTQLGQGIVQGWGASVYVYASGTEPLFSCHTKPSVGEEEE